MRLSRTTSFQTPKSNKLKWSKPRLISTIKPNSNSKRRNNQRSRKQLFIIGENSLPIPTCRRRTEAIISRCTKTRSSNTRSRRGRKKRRRNKVRREIRDGRLTTTKSQRSQIEMETMERTKELRATISMIRRKTLMICSMNQKRMRRSIFNTSKVKISNTPTKERKMN